MGNIREPESEQPQVSETRNGTVVLRITDEGYYYKKGKLELGPFTVQDEQELIFDKQLAQKLDVEPKELFTARLRETNRPTTFAEIDEKLSLTIRRDTSTKLVLFAACLLAFSEQDQINVLMTGESSTGKTHNALEVVSYFPQNRVMAIATASPSAFFHETGEWDPDRSAVIVDLQGKVLLFLDQPHYSLLEKLRPLSSHDQRELLYKITDKNEKAGLRTKNVIVRGFPSIIFCGARFGLDEQEKTRVFILSPDFSSEKLDESLRLAIAKAGDREAFRLWVESNPRRKWLKERITAIANSGVKNVMVPFQQHVYDEFKRLHPKLAPRHQRDIVRILALVKAHALLNYAHRERKNENEIVATKEDVDAGFKVYGMIVEANELGLSPQLYEIYTTVVKPLLEDRADGFDRKAVSTRYRSTFGRNLSDDKLRRDVLPALESAGLLVQITDPKDRRRTLVFPPDPPPNSPERENRGEVWGAEE